MIIPYGGPSGYGVNSHNNNHHHHNNNNSMHRWNPDNPASSPQTPLTHGSRASIDSTTPSRRSAGFQSTVFAAPPQTRARVSSRVVHTIHGACETKQTAFEWPISHVRELKAQLEAEDDDGEDGDDARHEALSGEGAYFDDLAYRIHLERSPRALHLDEAEGVSPAPPTEPTLSLAIIALWAKYSDIPPDEPFERQVFVGLKQFESEHDRELGEPAWLWSTSSIVSFSKRQEYWEVNLPALSTLLENETVAARDAFSIRVVVKHASEPGLPPLVHADQQFISRRITRMAGSFIDSIRTGDVRFLCLEHAGSETPVEDRGRLARRRAVYAHSELLVHTDYFKSTLSGGFAETSDAAVTTLLVDDASFSTVYWVLRWLYTDEIVFSSTESVRAVMTQVRVDKAAARRVLDLESWEYQPIEDDDVETRTVRSVSSMGTTASGRRSPAPSTGVPSGASSRRPSAVSPTPSTAPTPTPRTNRPAATASTPSGVPRIATASCPARKPAAKPKPSPPGAPKSPPVSRSPYSIPRRAPVPDPHPHPSPPPPSASPLAVFFLAHRYGLSELEAVARDFLLRHLTPQTCVATLLATHSFPDLHSSVTDYVSDNWAEVSASPELDRCYQEVSAGVWGEHEGGQVLVGLTRRLTNT